MIFEKNNVLKQTSWREFDEATVRKTKTTAYKELTQKLLEDKLDYCEHML